MKPESFATALVRNSERAIRSAYLSLRDGDPDNAVNRAYYAMYNVARASLLSLGVPEGELPRTHRGLIEAFRIHAVQTGRIDSDMGSNLSRTENLRLKADYTGAEIDATLAREVVSRAEQFVRTVEAVFGLGAAIKDRDVVRESLPGLGGEPYKSAQFRESGVSLDRSVSHEETRLKAIENWRRNYYDKRHGSPGEEMESAENKENSADDEKTLRERDDGLEFDPDR